jgi:broad specificity phosphatase PhoE
VRTLFLARHAEAEGNHAGLASGVPPGAGLTAAGRSQAAELGRILGAERVELGVSSEFLRTQETLALALAGRGVPALVLPELNEIRFGRFDGGTLAAYRAWAWSSSPGVDAPGGGESRAAAAGRYAAALETLLARPERTILAIAHALPLRYVLDAAAGLVPAARVEPVEHARPWRLGSGEVAAAAEALRAWSAAPVFRSARARGGGCR